MIASNENNVNKEDPNTLSGWVRKFRIKRSEMKRKERGNLRVNAMLNTALLIAEADLRRKQKERFDRWAEFQAKLATGYTITSYVKQMKASEEEKAERQAKVDSLWKCELSDLDSFMRSLSSSNNNRNRDNTITCENDYKMRSENSNVLQSIASTKHHAM